ncbi:Transcription factor, MADS-box [Dillenia turbinata]|uniref:Transcription factor, MADS-box n=1 Tax=Dillenia turbinata TaxID=194707 RepID=A0AAN8VM41_9MAGN
MGKRKIEIKKITEKSKLMVTFSKRRQGLMSKSAELSRVSGAQIALIVTSPANKFFTYGHPSADCVINRFLGTEDNVKDYEDNFVKDEAQRKEIEVLERLLEVEKEKERKLRCSDDRYSWVLYADDTMVKGLELDELVNYINALEELKNSMEKRIFEVEMEMTSQPVVDHSLTDHLSPQDVALVVAILAAVLGELTEMGMNFIKSSHFQFMSEPTKAENDNGKKWLISNRHAMDLELGTTDAMRSGPYGQIFRPDNFVSSLNATFSVLQLVENMDERMALDNEALYGICSRYSQAYKS